MPNERLIQSIKRRNTQSPLRTYLWRMELPLLDSRLSIDEVFEVSNRIVAATVPYDNFETGKTTWGNSYWYFASGNDIGNISIELLEYEDGLTFKYFDMWKKLIANENGTYNPPVYYKREVKFYRLDTNKDDVIMDTYAGYFCTNIADSSNDYESNGILRVQVNLSGDSHKARQMLPISGKEVGFETAINRAKTTKQSIIEFLF